MKKPEPQTIQYYEAAELLQYFICSAASELDTLHHLKKYLEDLCGHRSYSHFNLKPKVILDSADQHHRAVLQFANFILEEFELDGDVLHLWSWYCSK